jgi:hypothetical protein
MSRSQHIGNKAGAPAAQGARSQGKKTLRVVVATDGSRISLHVVRKETAGFELDVSTDGDCAEVTVESEEAPALPGVAGLRLYPDRPA